jgi:hypothetical protein
VAAPAGNNMGLELLGEFVHLCHSQILKRFFPQYHVCPLRDSTELLTQVLALVLLDDEVAGFVRRELFQRRGYLKDYGISRVTAGAETPFEWKT